MYKIAISGKANSGKDSLAKMLIKEFNTTYKIESFARPIKQIVKIMFPKTKNHILYGSSGYRSMIVPGVFDKEGMALTYRQLLQEIGTEVGRSYKDDIWIDIIENKLRKEEKKGTNLFIVPDFRFINECDFLKKQEFILIRLIRNSQFKMNHKSETEQEDIKDSEFDFIIQNNGTLDDLHDNVNQIAKKIINF